jgi:hypothetical protein
MHPLLVDLRLSQCLDDSRPIKETAARRSGPAERLPTLDDIVVADQVALLYAAEGAAAW